MRSRSFYVRLLVAGLGGMLGLSAWVAYLTWPRDVNIKLRPSLPVVKLDGDRLVVQVRSDALLAQVSDYSSELEAYLHYEYVKSHLGLASSRVLLTVKDTQTGPCYQIFLVLDNDLLSDVPYLARAQARGYIPGYTLYPASFQDLARKRLETAVFLGSYDPASTPRLSSLPQSRLLLPLANFLLFKSTTDRRVREHIPPTPTPLSFGQAKELAADILDVVHFYNLPLDVFLGIGAMENNYMNVRGDLDHAVWKRRPQRGDIILKRSGGRYLVSDYAMGVWQITRETLRRAHDLYLLDQRDYSVLPPRLRPAREFSLNLDNSEVLTTYAGLLLRHLLDETHGDLAKAAGAYNGSLQKPNYQYAAGVEAVALYARDFLERAANLDGLSVGKSWLVGQSDLGHGEEIASEAPATSRGDLNLNSE